MEDANWHQLKEEFTCAICKDFLRNPKVLPCRHYFCTDCLEKWARKKYEFHCPICRGNVVLSTPGAVEELPSHFPADYQVEILCAQAIHRAQERMHSRMSTTPMCQNCGEEEANSFCSSCPLFLCNFCEQAHQKSIDTREHPILTVEDMQHNTNLAVPSRLPKRIKNCPVHPMNPLELYCRCEDVLICQECTRKKHKNHDYDVITTDVVDGAKRTLNGALPGIQNLIDEVEGAINGVKSKRKYVKIREKESFQKLDDVFCILHTALDERKRQLQQQITQDTAEKDKSLAVQESELRFLLNRLTDCWHFINDTLEKDVHHDVLAMKRLMLQRRNTLKEMKERTNLIPITHQHFPLILNVTDIENHCGSFCDPRKCLVTKMKASVPVRKINSFRIVLKDLFGNNIYNTSKTDIDVLIQYENKPKLTDHDIATVRVADSNMFEGSYFCKGSPSHFVSVMVGGEHIDGSPFK